MIGLYPIVTQPLYLLESPWFDEINVTVNDNQTLQIRSTGDPIVLGQKGYFVKAIKINGKHWDRNWVEHQDLMLKGGRVEFDVGFNPTLWETGDRPPSPGHEITHE